MPKHKMECKKPDQKKYMKYYLISESHKEVNLIFSIKISITVSFGLGWGYAAGNRRSTRQVSEMLVMFNIFIWVLTP